MTGRNQEFQVHSKCRHTADVYRFVFRGSLSGWVIFTICDETGELSVQSDWGCWGHRWNIEHLGNGATLTEFIRDRDPEHADYLANKLSYSMPSDARRLPDEEGTEKAIRDRILELRRDGSVTAEDAREAWDDVEMLMMEYSEGGPSVAYWAMPESIFKVLGSDIYEHYFALKEAPCLTILRENLLPLLITELQSEQVEQQKG